MSEGVGIMRNESGGGRWCQGRRWLLGNL